MPTHNPSRRKPAQQPIHKFFTNGFVQGVAVFIALAVAFSGKLDSKGTLVAVLVAGAIGVIGIYTHCSQNVWKKILAGVLIVIYGCALFAFYSYLTSKTLTNTDAKSINVVTNTPSEPTSPITEQPLTHDTTAHSKTKKSSRITVPKGPEKTQPSPSTDERVGKAEIVKNEGTIERTEIDHNKITGAPPPNTENAIIDNPRGGKITDSKIHDNEIAYLPVDAPIPPPIGKSDLKGSYKFRINQLIRDTAQWRTEAEHGAPSPEIEEQYREYWQAQMKQFHETIGKQILITMSQLRNCNYPFIKRVYWLEKAEARIPAMLIGLLADMRSLAQELPDDDSQISCAE